MPVLSPLTINVPAGPGGTLMDLGALCSRLQVVVGPGGAARVRAKLLRPGDAAPIAPVADPLPAALGTMEAGWVPLVANGQQIFEADPFGVAGYRYVEVWYTAASTITAQRVPDKSEA